MASSGTSSKKVNIELILGGIAVFIAGLIVWLWPGLSMYTLAIIVGIILIVAGCSGFITYFSLRKTAASLSGWAIVNAICDILLGIMLLLHPIVASEILYWVLGIYVVVYGCFAIITGIGLRKAGPGWWLMLLWGLVAVFCGITFMMVPSSFVLFLGILLLMRGVTLVVYGFTSPTYAPLA